MRSAESAVRARAITMLAGDADLTGRVHGIFDGTPPRASVPYVAIGPAEGTDWGTKDRAGREVQLTVTLRGVGDSLDDAAAARIEAVAATMRGAADGWTIVSARIVRTRFGFVRESGWREDFVVRCRCLAG